MFQSRQQLSFAGRWERHIRICIWSEAGGKLFPGDLFAPAGVRKHRMFCGSRLSRQHILPQQNVCYCRRIVECAFHTSIGKLDKDLSQNVGQCFYEALYHALKQEDTCRRIFVRQYPSIYTMGPKMVDALAPCLRILI